MPQMMPVNWILLLLFVTIIYILFNILNYFIFTYKNSNNMSFILFKKSFNWKW